DRWNCVPRGKYDELIASAEEVRVMADKQSTDPLSNRGLEGGPNLAVATGLQDKNLPADRSSCVLHVGNGGVGARVGRVHQNGNQPSLRHELVQQCQLLRFQLGSE